MPRKSQKNQLIAFSEELFFNNLIMLEIFEEDDEVCKSKEEELTEEYIISVITTTLLRYGAPLVHNSVPKSNTFLTDVIPFLDENRFKQIVRLSWSNFKIVYNLIKDDDIFHGPRSCRQFPVMVQLIIVLYRLGSSGEGATIAKMAAFFGVGDGGSIKNMTDRIFTAILNIQKQFLYWPDSNEREKLVLETFDELPYCFGYVDGTEIKVAEAPVEDPDSYYSRKRIYSMKVQAVCDHNLKIRHMVLGYAGSVHDSRIYKNCELATNPTNYFNGFEWLAGDSAYKITPTVITPFRANSNDMTLKERNDFNKRFCSYRVRIEHCFGHLKERFNSLKELKLQVRDKGNIKFICRWILCCAILHNVIREQNNGDIFFVPDENYSDMPQNEAPENSTPCDIVFDGEEKRRILASMILHN